MNDVKTQSLGNLHHVGLVVKDIESAVKTFSAIGIGPFQPAPMKDLTDRELRGKKQPSHVDVWFAPMGDASLELVQPQEGESLQSETLRNRGECVEHIGFFVEDIWGRVDKMTANGWRVVASARGPETGGWAFLEPASGQGLYVELVEPWE